MDQLKTYTEAGRGAWLKTTDAAGQTVITNGEETIPVVGTLSAATTPGDFAEFAARAAAWRAGRDETKNPGA